MAKDLYTRLSEELPHIPKGELRAFIRDATSATWLLINCGNNLEGRPIEGNWTRPPSLYGQHGRL